MSEYKTFVEESVSYWTFEQVKERVDHLSEKYGLSYTDFEMNYDSDYDLFFPTICYYRPETELEKQNREEQEQRWAEQKLKAERQQYELLKKKFENNSI